jgi:hypothetical protein
MKNVWDNETHNKIELTKMAFFEDMILKLTDDIAYKRELTLEITNYANMNKTNPPKEQINQ